MGRILLFISLIAGGITMSFSRFFREQTAKEASYQITLIKATHLKNANIVDYNEPYYLKLTFIEKADPLKERKKLQAPLYNMINPISEIKIISTEKMDEQHEARTDISSLFDFHYIRRVRSMKGSLVKERITVPFNDFINTVNQTESLNQLKELKLMLRQKPVLQSEHKFIIIARLQNGEVLRDTTSGIIFEGIPPYPSY
jgi:hypothetical protein